MQQSRVINGDVIDTLKTLPENAFHTCITSPPYFGIELNPEYAAMAEGRINGV